MAVFRVEKTRDYTVIANHHLKDTRLSLKAKGLLSMMLSLPEEWNYTTRGLAKICKEGVDSIGGALRELEQAGYILRRQLRDARGRISDTEYVIFELPQAQPDTPLPDTARPCTVLPDTENPYLDKPDAAPPDTGKPAQLNTYVLNTNPESPNGINTLGSILPSFFPSEDGRKERRNEIQRIRDEIKEQIEYDIIADDISRDNLDELVEIMVEVACTKSPTIKIGRDAEYPTELVQERFSSIRSSHIEKILTGIKENTTRVWNTKAYLMAVLFNAPATMDNHYTFLVNHDLYGSY